MSTRDEREQYPLAWVSYGEKGYGYGIGFASDDKDQYASGEVVDTFDPDSDDEDTTPVFCDGFLAESGTQGGDWFFRRVCAMWSYCRHMTTEEMERGASAPSSGEHAAPAGAEKCPVCYGDGRPCGWCHGLGVAPQEDAGLVAELNAEAVLWETHPSNNILAKLLRRAAAALARTPSSGTLTMDSRSIATLDRLSAAATPAPAYDPTSAPAVEPE